VAEKLLTSEQINRAGLFAPWYAVARPPCARSLPVRRPLPWSAALNKLLPAGFFTLRDVLQGRSISVVFAANHHALPRSVESNGRLQPWHGQVLSVDRRSAVRSIQNEAMNSSVRSAADKAKEAARG